MQIGNFILGHRGDFDIVRRRQFAILVELFARSFQFLPEREQLLHAGMFPHDFAGAFPILEERGISDLALELGEALAFAFDQGIKVHGCPVVAIADRGRAGIDDPGYKSAKLFSERWRERPSCRRSAARISPRARPYRRTSVPR